MFYLKPWNSDGTDIGENISDIESCNRWRRLELDLRKEFGTGKCFHIKDLTAFFLLLLFFRLNLPPKSPLLERPHSPVLLFNTDILNRQSPSSFCHVLELVNKHFCDVFISRRSSGSYLLSVPVPDAFILFFSFSFFIHSALSVMMMGSVWWHLTHNGSLRSRRIHSADALGAFALEIKKWNDYWDFSK